MTITSLRKARRLGVFIMAAVLLNIRIWASIPGGPLTIFTWGIIHTHLGNLAITAIIPIRVIFLCIYHPGTGVIVISTADITLGVTLTGITVIAVILRRIQVITAVAADTKGRFRLVTDILAELDTTLAGNAEWMGKGVTVKSQIEASIHGEDLKRQKDSSGSTGVALLKKTRLSDWTRFAHRI